MSRQKPYIPKTYSSVTQSVERNDSANYYSETRDELTFTMDLNYLVSKIILNNLKKTGVTHLADYTDFLSKVTKESLGRAYEDFLEQMRIDLDHNKEALQICIDDFNDDNNHAPLGIEGAVVEHHDA